MLDFFLKAYAHTAAIMRTLRFIFEMLSTHPLPCEAVERAWTIRMTLARAFLFLPQYFDWFDNCSDDSAVSSCAYVSTWLSTLEDSAMDGMIRANTLAHNFEALFSTDSKNSRYVFLDIDKASYEKWQEPYHI